MKAPSILEAMLPMALAGMASTPAYREDPNPHKGHHGGSTRTHKQWLMAVKKRRRRARVAKMSRRRNRR